MVAGKTAMLGVFVALDIFLYYGFWEFTLVPMAVLIAMLEGDYDVDFNGVMLLSQILGFDNSVDGPEYNF